MSINTSDSENPTASTTAPLGLATRMQRIARAVDGQITPGDVAFLRRMRPGVPQGGAFWKAVALLLDDCLPGDGPARDEAERRWAAILQAAATLKGLHRPDRRLGHVLAGERFAEMRFLRLLRASGDRLAEEIRAAAHYIASKAAGVNLTELALLVLSDGRDDEEAVRRRLARDFYTLANQT